MKLIKENVWNPTDINDIRDLPQLYGYNSKDVVNPLITQFISHLPIGEYIIDTKLHMLMEGWYPCIPGWHYDEILRKPNGDLDFVNNDSNKKHYLFIYDEGSGSLTEFCDFYDGSIHNYTELNKMIKEYKPLINSVQNNSIYEFGCIDAHRGIPATGKGWRYFIRATINSQRQFLNEIRTQSQVYLPAVDIGW